MELNKIKEHKKQNLKFIRGQHAPESPYYPLYFYQGATCAGMSALKKLKSCKL